MNDLFDFSEPISAPLAELCARLLRDYPPEPCAHTPAETAEYITSVYPFRPLPPDHSLVKRFTLELIESHYPDELLCAPDDLTLREDSACSAAKYRGLDIRCFELENRGAGAEQYALQKQDFERRAAAFGLTWKPRPITVCMELGSGYYTVSGSEEIRYRILVHRGLTEEQIAQQPEAVLYYLRARHALGEIE